MSKTFVKITEVGTRDGFQAEREFIPTADKIAVIDALIDAGLSSVEATSFVSPRALPQLADAADVLAQIRRKPGTEIAVLVPNARGAERAAAAKADVMVGFISASESHCKTNLNKTIDEAIADFAQVVPIAEQWGIKMHGGMATAFGCPFEGDVPIENILKIVPMVCVVLALATRRVWPRHPWSHVLWTPCAISFLMYISLCTSTIPAA